MSKYKYLLFDLDGTLFDIHAVEVSALKQTLEQNSLIYNDEIFNQYSKINEELWKEFELGKLTKWQVRFKRFEILTKRFFKDKSCDLNKISDTYFQLFSKTVFAYKGVDDLLDNLSKEYELYVISNGSIDVQYYKLNKLDLTKYFKNIFLSEEIGFAKPNKQFFEYVHKQLNCPQKDKVLVIGDSISADIEGGANFGYDTCYVGINECNISTYKIDNVIKLTQIIKSNS